MSSVVESSCGGGTLRDLGLSELIGRCRVENVASARVLAKLGFRRLRLFGLGDGIVVEIHRLPRSHWAGSGERLGVAGAEGPGRRSRVPRNRPISDPTADEAAAIMCGGQERHARHEQSGFVDSRSGSIERGRYVPLYAQ